MPRNSSGTYSLPAGNPVVTGTLIETNWANPTMSDIGSAITDSLDRFGRGGMLAQLKLSDGTLAAPAFAFNSEASTGLYRPSAATLNVSVLGTLVASFTNTAITLAKPVTLSAALAWLAGTAALPGLAVAGDPDTGFYSPGANSVGASTNGVSRWVTTDEGLGLNQTPAALSSVGPQFQVKGRDATHAGYIAAVESTAAAWLTLYSGITVADNPSIIFNNTGALRFGTSTAQAAIGYAELMRLTAAGRLGIGRTPTASLLEVAGSSSLVVPNGAVDLGYGLTVTSVAAVQVGFNNSGGTNTFGAPTGTAYLGSPQGVPLVLTTSATEWARVSPAGLVGIGTPSPSVKLDVRTATAGNGVMLVGNTGASTTFNCAAFSNFTDADFNINISGAGAGTKFVSVGPTVNIPLIFNITNTERMRLDANGLAVGGATASTYKAIFYGDARAVNAGWTMGGTYTPQSGDVGIGREGSGGMILATAGATRMTLSAGGLVGIGRTPTTFALETQGIIKAFGAAASDIAVSAEALGVIEARMGVNNSGSTNGYGIPTSSIYFGTAQGANLYFSTSAVARLGITTDGRVFGTALHNNAGAVTGTTNQYIASGTYTPTITAVFNSSAPATSGTSKWCRVGNVVTVSGNFTCNSAASNTLTQVDISLPIPSNLAVFSDLAGVAGDGGNPLNQHPIAARVEANQVNDRASVIWLSPSASVSADFRFTFQYEIL